MRTNLATHFSPKGFAAALACLIGANIFSFRLPMLPRTAFSEIVFLGPVLSGGRYAGGEVAWPGAVDRLAVNSGRYFSASRYAAPANSKPGSRLPAEGKSRKMIIKTVFPLAESGTVSPDPGPLPEPVEVKVGSYQPLKMDAPP
ncbi:MAG: hypothetical protein HQL23_01730 [Candidatus Omnitrophica bacterium]|nr:hypothetical protein [Candidatus Omnitrophota bacterium]